MAKISGNRLLVVIASHGTGNDRYLERLIHEYRSMSLDVDIVVLSNLQKPVPQGVELIVGLPTKNPWSLPFGHKKVFADRQNNYDLFIYSEDDTLIAEKNIRAFVALSDILPENEIPGFLRFEQGEDGTVNYPEVHGRFHWEPASVRRRGEYTLAFFSCEHSACYLITKRQLKQALDSGGFLVAPHQGKYDLACSAATDPYTQCGFEKLVCVSHINDFLVHHLPNKYIGTNFGIHETEFREQINALMKIGQNGCRPVPLFRAETTLTDGDYSANFYEPVRTEIESLLPGNVRSVLSVGCGWGATEAWLARKGIRIVAIPIDPVIGAVAAGRGVEILNGDLKTVQEKLADRRFDCLLLLNILHLVESPVQLLSVLGKFLTDGGTVVALAPNMSRVADIFRGGSRSNGLGKFEQSGVHVISRRIMQQWLEEAGLSQIKTLDVLRNGAEKKSKWSLGLLDSILGYEFFAVAQKK